MKVAVFVDAYGTVLPFQPSNGTVEIYSDEAGKWTCLKKIALNTHRCTGINDILDSIRMLAREFEDCQLLVVESVIGIAQSYLKDFQIGVWLQKGRLMEESLLNYIRTEVHHALDELRKEHPTETDCSTTESQSECSTSCALSAVCITTRENSRANPK